MSTRRELVDVYLTPAQVGVFTAPTRVRTILGSCVALCLWDRGKRIGGINHYLLARASATPDGDSDLRYGNSSNRILLERMRAAGARPTHLEAAVIGGGHPAGATSMGRQVGLDNARGALELLQELGIRVVRQETGGARGRQLLFGSHSGELIVRLLGGDSGVVGGASR